MLISSSLKGPRERKSEEGRVLIQESPLRVRGIEEVVDIYCAPKGLDIFPKPSVIFE